MDLSQLGSQNSPQLNGVLKGSSSGGLRSTLKLAKSLSLSSKPNDPKDDGTRALFWTHQLWEIQGSLQLPKVPADATAEIAPLLEAVA